MGDAPGGADEAELAARAATAPGIRGEFTVLVAGADEADTEAAEQLAGQGGRSLADRVSGGMIKASSRSAWPASSSSPAGFLSWSASRVQTIPLKWLSKSIGHENMRR